MPKPTQHGLIDSQSWDDYRWHLANRIVNVDMLRDWIDVTDDEATAIEACAGVYRWSITPLLRILNGPGRSRMPSAPAGRTENERIRDPTRRRRRPRR